MPLTKLILNTSSVDWIKRVKKTGKALGKHVINLYSTEISRVVKIWDVKKLQQNIENDPTIKDQMANLGFLLVCTFGNFPALVLVAAHTVNNFMNNALKTRVTKKTRIFCVWCPDTKRFLTKRKKDVFFVGQSFIKKKKKKRNNHWHWRNSLA